MRKWFNEKFIPQASKLGNQRHLSSIRDAFAIFTPVIIVGAIAVLWRSVIFPPGGGEGTLGGLWTAFNGYAVTGQSYTEYLTVMNHWMLYIQTGTISVMSLYIAFGIGYFLAQSRGNNTPVIAGLVSLASFLAVTNMMVTDSWEAGMYWIGARGLISAIVVGLLMTELFCWMSKGDKMAIKMPAGVPPAVSRAFAKLFPAMLTVIAAAAINLFVWMPFHFTNSALSEGTGVQYTFWPSATHSAGNGTFTAAQLAALGKDGLGATKDMGVAIHTGGTFTINSMVTTKATATAAEVVKTGTSHIFTATSDIAGISAGDHFTYVVTAANGATPAVTQTYVATAADAKNYAQPWLGSYSVTAPNADALGRAFKVFTPDMYTNTITNVPMHGGDVTLTNAIYAGVVQPFVSMAGSTGGAFGIAILYVLLISFFWFFGLHGTNIVNGAFNPIWLILYANNVAGANNVFVQGTFDAFVFLGGWGATLALIIATLAFGKKGSGEREISKFALAPGIFQINEPVTFGYPLVLNAFLVIPLFLIMPILVVTTYAGIEWFGIKPVKVLIPWTMPVGFGGLVATGDPWGFVLAIANLAIATALWTPFVLLMKNKDAKDLAAKASNTIEGKKAAEKAAKKAAAKA